jgi:hypothetical protein
MKKDEMGGTSSTYGKDEKCIQKSVEKSEAKRQLEKLKHR